MVELWGGIKCTVNRLGERYFDQIARVLEINELQLITKVVVETARASLVIGPLP